MKVFMLVCLIVAVVAEDVNWALNKPSSQSSTYGSGSSPECDAKWANDGSMDTRAVTQEWDGNAWWQVDLQKMIKIKDVTLKFSEYPLKDDKYQNVVISTKTSEEGEWTVCKEAGHLTSALNVIKCDQPTKAQLVRVALKSKNRLYLGEVEVHSVPELRCDGQDNGCCTDSTPCGLGEGDCDKNSHCAGSLVCGDDNCPWGDHDDCCMSSGSSPSGSHKVTNVALNKPAQQSSTYGSGSRPDCDAKWANDGNIETGAVTQEWDGNAWWEVNLETSYKIIDVTLKFDKFPLKDDKYQNVVILTRTKVGEWTVCKEAGHLTTTPSVIICDKPTEAQFVRVALKSKNRLYLGEVEVHA